MSKVSASKQSSLSTLTLAALGVVYGDIGTSPLYALKEVFHGGHVPVTSANIIGVLSLIFWTMTIIVSLKYVMLILRADNNGEGGLIAMLALATMAVRERPPLRRTLMLVGLFGTAIFFGDAVITPAMTVLGAVEGIDVYEPQFHDAILPLTLVVMVGLFSVQRFGTGGIGKAFGPVMLAWFFVLALLGLVLAAGSVSPLGAAAARRPNVLFILTDDQRADAMSIALVTATQCAGTILLFEKLFESRLFFVDKLVSMGARIVLCDPHRVVVSGPARLYGERLESPDIRAGMAMLIAALAAEGTTTIGNVGQIDRGYERIDERLRGLGAAIERVTA